MSHLVAFGRFVYDFVVGDDPLIAVIVVLGLGATAAIAGAGLTAWWVLPAVVLVALSVSLMRATRAARD